MIGETFTTVRCPSCGTAVMVPLVLKYRRDEDAVVEMHTEGIHLHIGLAHPDEAAS